MAGAFTAIADDVSAAGLNPAGLFQVSGATGQALVRLPYAGTGVHAGSIVACLPAGRVGTVGLRLSESGVPEFSQRCLRLAHGFRLAENLAAGYGLCGYNLAEQGLGQGFAFGLDVGLFARIYRSWTVGFVAHNLNSPSIGGSALPERLSFGLGFSPAPGISSALDVSKEPGQATRVAVGQEFRIVEDLLTVRAGVQTEPVALAFGLRTGYKPVHVDYSLRTHARLPFSHALGLTVDF
jgi:hypothetical protein